MAKALKINTTVNLENGDSVNTGSVLIFEQINVVTIPVGLYYNIQVNTKLFKSENAWNNGKKNFKEIQDFNPIFNVQMLITDYSSAGNFENKIINLVKTQLGLIYPTFVEIINV